MVAGAMLLKGLNDWAPSGDLTRGYTIVLPVPGDLPVLLKIALEVCAAQDDGRLVEIVVVPDQSTPEVHEILRMWTNDHAASSVRLVQLKATDQLILRRYNHPHINHWLQVIRGIETVRTSHALLHDADLVIVTPYFLKEHYEACAARGLACLGVSEVWDSWYRDQGITHLVATWEAMFDVTWFRSFTPYEHRGRDGMIAGHRHGFDLTFWPQCQTPPHRIGHHNRDDCFIHFNHLICTYRWFQQSETPFEDDHFRLLLIRLLADAYDPLGMAGNVPSLAELAGGMTDGSTRVTYREEQTRLHYAGFRLKLQRLIDSDLLDSGKATALREGVQPFDKAFGSDCYHMRGQ